MLKDIKEHFKRYKILVAVRDIVYKQKAMFMAIIKGNKGTCPCCKDGHVYFLELDPSYIKKYERFNREFLNCEMLSVEKHSCSKCGASDRERLYALWMSRNTDEGINSILEIAPGNATRMFIKENFPSVKYKTADLVREDVDYNLDIEDMCAIEDNSFDMFICSHVLEHVSNDLVAMKELKRVIRKNGFGIMTVPIPINIKAFDEDIYEQDDEIRWVKFGDATHVRVYTKVAFIERAAMAGLSIKEFGIDYFGEELYEQCGIKATSVLYIAYKS